MINDYEKARLGAKTLCDFFEQFGNDVYSNILLEVILEGIINEESVFISGEQEQTGHQDDNDFEDRDRILGEIEGCEESESTPDMGEEDSSDNL